MMNTTAPSHLDGRPDRRRLSSWFQLVISCCAVFILTIFLMLVAAFRGGPPSLTRFFNDYGLHALGVEVGAILTFAAAAMAADRRETLRKLRLREESQWAQLENTASARPGGQDLSGSSKGSP